MIESTMRFLINLGVCLITPATALAQDINFGAFHTPAQFESELMRLPTRFPGLAQVITIGTSLLGAPIKAVKISDNVAADEPAEGDVLFVALHHAREWISTETALFIAEQLLKRYSTDAQLKADIDNLQLWIIPVMNPDGYAYTANAAGDRYWRKNRRNNGDGTFGVDLNRNWGYQWGLLSGSSASTVDETYHGTGAFSEPEAAVIRDFANSRNNLKVLVSFHSFSELYLRPWSYTTADPPGESTLASIVQRNIAAIAAVHGHTYSQTIWYTSAGEATDYFWGEKRIAAFTPELRPAGGGLGGFAPPASEIVPTGEENVPAAVALLHDAGSREVWIRDHAGDTGAEPSAVWTGSGWSAAFWESPDIWTVPATLTEGTSVTLNIRVLNNTGAAMTNVNVAAYWTDPRIALEFPSLTTTVIGQQTITVPPAGTTITMPWTVPTGTNSWGERHWCVGVVVTHSRDMPLTTQAERSSNVAIKNFSTTVVTASQTLLVEATNFLNVDAELRVVVDSLRLLPGWRVVVPRPAPREARGPLSGIERKGRLLAATGQLLRPGESALVPVRVEVPRGAVAGQSADVRIQGALLPLVPGRRQVLGNGFTYRVVVDSTRRR